MKVGVGGRKSRIIMSMSAASEFKSYLIEFSDYNSSLGIMIFLNLNNSLNRKISFIGPINNNESTGEEDGLLKSKTLSKDRKRYYLDFKENQRGRFLRVINEHYTIDIKFNDLIKFRFQWL